MTDADDLLDDLLSWTGPSPTTAARGLTPCATPTNVVMSGTPHAVAAAAACAGSGDSKAASALASVPPLALPADLDEKLFPHQRAGVQWLYYKHCKARACLLADEMGLGKTIQVCTFLGQLYRDKAAKTAILVVPPTLVPMWEKALTAWGRLEPKLVEVVHGDSKAKRVARWKKLSYGLPCVMLTTYGVLRQDATAMGVTMVDYVILDEAHLIKDASTHAFKAALMLSARHRIALTGTPLMNSFEDMWSIFKFLDGAIISLSRAQFGTVSATLLRGNERDATGQQRAAAESELAKLQAAIQPFMLRREKKDLGLSVVGSRKHDTVLWVRLSAEQEALYRAFLDTPEAVSAATAAPPAQAADGGEAETDITAMQDVGDEVAGEVARRPAGSSPLLLLTMLSQICNHPWLQLTDGAFHEALARPVGEAPCAEVGSLLSGTKLSVTLSLLQWCAAQQRKALVFSRSKRLLAILARLLKDRGVSHVRIDGDIASTTERFRAVEAFNDDPAILACLLTTQVGGVGLTFESASCVVLLDPSWNPSADAQAVDRVHRIGQRHSDVHVFRLVTSGTVEEKVYRNQVFKTMAAKQSLQASSRDKNDSSEDGGCGDSQPDRFFRYFTRLQLRSMFEVGDLAASETAAQLELLHPGRVDDTVRAVAATLPDVCATSDNGCVLCEDVASEAAEAGAALARHRGRLPGHSTAVSSLSSSPSCSQTANDGGVSFKRTRAASRSPRPAAHRPEGRTEEAEGGEEEEKAALASLMDSILETSKHTIAATAATTALPAEAAVETTPPPVASAHDTAAEDATASGRSSASFAECVDVDSDG